MTSVQELIGNCFYISLCRSTVASFKICLSYAPTQRQVYMLQELNAVVLYVVIVVPSQFLLTSVFLTPVLVRHTARNYCMIRMPGYEDFFFFVSWSNFTISYDLQQLAWSNFS